MFLSYLPSVHWTRFRDFAATELMTPEGRWLFFLFPHSPFRIDVSTIKYVN